MRVTQYSFGSIRAYVWAAVFVGILIAYVLSRH
jgi:hypothetical protein